MTSSPPQKAKILAQSFWCPRSGQKTPNRWGHGWV